MVNDEAGWRDEEVIYSVESTAHRRGMDCVMGHAATGLLDNLTHSIGCLV